ncbi:hypothetical protein CANARDRAFT_7062 [[Candida] arabinofermentans NRRL YB-2248]|uniref:Mitochondrial carrier protein n=1 Tax=[Candida] arabinofermentans NRRL YB-2248 TaxID=983967 RepID=A0A1E4T1S3_9ASCO|nr:hypothetical protein CANARDRAFT_7062 [[Candida] arabinofermentans NRRL YB-2248]
MSVVAAAIEEPDDLSFSSHNNNDKVSNVTLVHESSKPHDITLSQRMISACFGSILTSLLVTPFDVVRIRLQQQQLLFPTDLRDASECCRKVFWEPQTDTAPQAHTQAPPSSLSSRASAASVATKEIDQFCVTHSCAQDTKIKGTFQGISRIATQEGFGTLYRGLSLGLIMAVPSNMVYFSGYEFLRDSSPLKDGFPIINPLLCGSVARIMAATSVAPLELIKTRLQAVPSSSTSKSSDIMRMVLNNSLRDIQKKGVMSIFKGLQLTLWRDVPFSGIYWASYEYITYHLKNTPYFSATNTYVTGVSKDEDQLNTKIFLRSFISGSLSGMLAAVFTNPFDVGKTRMQVGLEEKKSLGTLSKASKLATEKQSMFKYLFSIYRNDGFGALYVGLIPRCMKIAPACAIMISTYELSKKIFADIQS